MGSTGVVTPNSPVVVVLPPPPSPPLAPLSETASYQEINAQGDEIVTFLQDEENTNEGSIPTTGTANYAGVAEFGDQGEDFVTVSQMALQANFGDSSVSGRFYDFQAPDGAIEGEVLIDGQVAGQDMTASLDGVVGGFAVQGDLNGQFVGQNVQGIVGNLSGSGFDDEGLFLFDGSFIGRR